MSCFTRKAAVAILAAASALIASAGSKKNAKAELSLSDLNGKKVKLSDYRGQLVVLNFWATWCGPCKAEMPMLVETEREYKERGVLFLGSSLDDGKTKARIPEFVSKYQIDYPVLVGATGDDLDKLAMGPAVPATAFIDKDGTIVARVSGTVSKAELKDRIEWLLSDRSGSPPASFVSHVDK
jgi:thiol-disulfide isomerase/thioredoxin